MVILGNFKPLKVLMNVQIINGVCNEGETVKWGGKKNLKVAKTVTKSATGPHKIMTLVAVSYQWAEKRT